MEYTELNFQVSPPEPGVDLLIASLGEVGFESFMEEEEGLLAYIPTQDYDKEKVDEVIQQYPDLQISYSSKTIADQNWNAVWESNFEPVIVGSDILVRASFHEVEGPFDYEIVIDPKMAFGTGHHSTTYLMLEQLLQLNVENAEVLDMGCGTGVLAILARMRGCASALAIDIDEWAYNNTLENLERNAITGITVEHGGVERLQNRYFNVILANINKNVILKDLQDYSSHMRSGADLLLSGFYEDDIPDILAEAQTCHLDLRTKKVRSGWSLLHLQKVD